jgi:uncharacterized protein with PIN domain
MLGLDCLYRNDFQDEDLAQIASTGEHILLSRDRRLLMRKAVRYGYCIRSLEPEEQISEVLARFALSGYIIPFHRCLRCNALLEPVEKSAVLDRLEPLTQLYFNEFHRCPACGQIYWKGSHYDQMVVRLHHLLPTLYYRLAGSIETRFPKELMFNVHSLPRRACWKRLKSPVHDLTRTSTGNFILLPGKDIIRAKSIQNNSGTWLGEQG